MRVAIVGCGIGGMAAATALARDGHEATVFERFATPHPVGAGLLLQPTGLDALDALGLREEVEAKGARIAHLRGRTPRGRRVLDLSYEAWRTGAYGLGIHRASLFEALHAAMSAAGARLITSAQIAAIDTPARPRLIDAQGRAHGPFDLAVIADGAASDLRPQIAPRARAPLYPWGAIWTIVPYTDEAWDGALAQVYSGAKVMIGVLPVGAAPGAHGKHAALFWSLREDEHEAWRARGGDHWRAQIDAYWPAAGALLGREFDFAALNFARYRDVQSWPWGAGATVLLGDCAHATSPQLGQGANLALADAVALARALKAHAPARALGVYRRARAGKIAWVQFMSAALTPFFQSRSAIMGWARDLVMAPLARLWPFNRLMLATLTGAASLPFAMLFARAAHLLLIGRARR